ncbi:MAG: type II toxin-antitoxin system VapB family antitoxin [Actinobacteria bacterium]|nr:type II toxin-antitoxin system VapB family antitoxin [Actinomycetota bacterium]
MAMTSVDLDPELIERARELTGERSNRAVLDLALRRLIASKQKGAMIDGIAELVDLPTEVDAPVDPPAAPAGQTHRS